MPDDPQTPRLIPVAAVQAGTVDAIDRSKQYTRTDPPILKHAIDEAWREIRLQKLAIQDRDRTIAELHQKLANRDTIIDRQADYLKTKDLVENLKTWAVRVLIGGQWALIAWLATQLFARIPK